MREYIGLPLNCIGLVPDLEYEAFKNRLLGGSILGRGNRKYERIFVLDIDVQDFDSLNDTVTTWTTGRKGGTGRVSAQVREGFESHTWIYGHTGLA